MTGVRARGAFVAVPVVAVLAVLLTVGLSKPDLIEPGPGPGAYRWAVVLAGAGVALTIAVSAVRSHGRLRWSWAAIGVSSGLWTLTVLGALSGWSDVLVWGVLRSSAVLAGAASLLLAPGVRRTAREWGLVLLDGWLVGGSVFLIGWVALEHTGSLLPSAADRPMIYWVGVDLLFASVTAGLAMRTERAVRTPVLLMVLVSLLGVTGDTTWALTGEPGFPVVQWLIMTVCLGIASTNHRLDLWQSARSEPSAPNLLRWSQVAVVPGLIAALSSHGDALVITVAASVILVMAGEIVLISRQNHELWAALRAQARRLDQVVSDSRDAIVQVDARGVVEFANGAVADVLGWSPRTLLGRALADMVHRDDLSSVHAQLGLLRGGRGAVRVTGRVRHRDGTWRCLEATVSRRSGEVPGLTILARDVSDEVLLSSELRRLATTDTLTGLTNRHGFLALLTERLATGEAAVLFVDLDGFKAVNDVLGHAAGDRLLQEMADALRAELGPDDVAARLGGDEFAVLTAHADRPVADDLALRIADRLRRLPSDPERRTSASIGVAVGRSGSAEALLGDADLAMYEAKAGGGGQHAIFDPGMRHRVTEQARRRASLERACAGDGLRLDVQPIVAMGTGAWVGFESLVRWQDGEHRRLPDTFLPLAEESGLIVALGGWALRTSLDWLGTWPDRSAGISVNLAARQVSDDGFSDLVISTLESSGVEPHRLTLEITERTAVDDIQRAGAVLQPLRALGVHVSLDDFGTGYSSLGYLAQLPVDELKIDRRFVAGLGVRPEDDALVRAVTRLAGDLGLRVVAEGVETAEQVVHLAERGCALGQGHYFLPPVPTDLIRPPGGTGALLALPERHAPQQHGQPRHVQPQHVQPQHVQPQHGPPQHGPPEFRSPVVSGSGP